MPTDSARRAERRRSGAGCIESHGPAPGVRPCRPRACVSRTSVYILRVCLAIFVAIPIVTTGTLAAKPQQQHNSNWAVLVETSKYWFNYRHMANTLSLYRTVKRLGIPDSNIILMMGDDVACDARNSFPGAIFNNRDHRLNLYGDNIEVDYRGYEVTVESFIRVLTGRHDAAVPRSKRLLSDAGSNVLVYITGHGGDGFMKFLDNEEMLSRDIADAIQQMWEKGRYRELLFMVETCQAGTLYADIRAPYVISCACSAKGEMSYSHHNDGEVGLSVIDRFTYHTLEFFEKVGIYSNVTLRQLFDSYDNRLLDSSFNFNAPDPTRLDTARVTEFFGSVASTRPTAMPAESSDGPAAGRSSDPDSSTPQAVDARPSSPHLLHRHLSTPPSHIASAESSGPAAPKFASLPAEHTHTGPSLLSRSLASPTSQLPTELPPMHASMDAAIAACFLALLAAAALRVALTSPPPSS